MPMFPRVRDIEQGSSDEEDIPLYFLEFPKIAHPGGDFRFQIIKNFEVEELGADGSLPTCSNSTENHLNPSNASTGPPESGSSLVSGKQKELNRRLLKALYKTEVDNDEIQKLLDEGAEPNYTCYEHGGDVFACHLVGLFGNDELQLMKLKAELMHASENWTPLHVAAYFTLPATVRLLLDAKADPSLCDDRGRTPLDVTGLVKAIRVSENLPNFTEVIQLLIDAGGQQNTMIGGYVQSVQTPLHTAVELRNQDAVELLLGHGASVACWNKAGLTPLHLCLLRKGPEQMLSVLISKGPDVVDSDGQTVLHVAIACGSLEGVQISLAAEANVTLMTKHGETPLHIMALDIAGWYSIRKPPFDNEIHEKYLRVLHEMVRLAKNNNAIDCLNRKGDTPLFLAVMCGKLIIAEKLLQEGASITHTTADGLNLLHAAAQQGYATILEMLLCFGEDATHIMLNSLTKTEGYGPIHFAVAENHLDCVKVFYKPHHASKGMDYCLQTGFNIEKSPYPKDTTPLHMAAANDNVDIATIIIEACFPFKKKYNPLDKADGNGWMPLHLAINKSNVNVIKYFVMDQNESLAKLTQSEKPETALNMIIQYITNPREFMKDLLDTCISYNLPNKVEISYRILMPKGSVQTPSQRSKEKTEYVAIAVSDITENKFDQQRPKPKSSDKTPSRLLKEEMDVIEALLKTGNEFNQMKLLLHPLIESFIYLKWQTMKPYYFLIASVYTLFVAWLVAFEVSVFTDKDICNSKPSLWKLIAGGFMIYFLAVLIILQELFMNFEGSKYIQQWRSWFKLGSLVPVFIVPLSIMASETAEWPRHVASLALFLVCIQMMNLLSQFPEWGYYVVMFKRVAFNVVKILASFSILLFCFVFNFKIQFHSEYPFDGAWDAIVKTLFMLSAEFEYNDVFESKNAVKLGSSFEVVRIILLVFLVFAAIVLMNMMVGVAVDDINELKAHGNIGRLDKQAQFVRSLDRLDYNLWHFILRCLPQSYERKKFPSKIILTGDVLTQEPDYGYNIERLPKSFKDAIYKIALNNKEKEIDNETNKDEQDETEKNKNIVFCFDKSRLDKLEEKINGINEKVDNLIKYLQQSR